MKKRLIALIILTLSFGVVGCTSDKEETASNSNEVVTQEESKEEKKRSSDEMYELYTSKLEEVEKFFKENNIDFKEDQSNKNKKYDGTVSISYENSDDNAKYSVAGYGIAFNSDGEIKSISAGITLNVIDEEMKNKKFKFEETEFYKLHNILVPDITTLYQDSLYGVCPKKASLSSRNRESGKKKNKQDYVLLIYRSYSAALTTSLPS